MKTTNAGMKSDAPLVKNPRARRPARLKISQMRVDKRKMLMRHAKTRMMIPLARMSVIVLKIKAPKIVQKLYLNVL